MTMTTTTRRLLGTAGMALATGWGGAALADGHGCGEVSITEMNWASAAVVTAVADFLMTEGYGCDVTRVPSSTNPALASVSETGEPDILTELWVNAAPVYDRMSEEGSLVTLTEVLSDGGVEGWWIPDYVLEEHPELATIDGVLANPDLVGGMFHQCPDGWACKTVNGNLAEAAGLEESGIEVFQHGSGETMATSIAAAFADEAPWFGYYWAPTSVLGQYPMTRVDIGAFDQEIHTCNGLEDCPDPRLSAYPLGKVVTVVTADFQEREPAIVDLMTDLSFTNEQMNDVLAWQEANNASAEEAAVYYLTAYADVWPEWLDDAARENLSALIEG